MPKDTAHTAHRTCTPVDRSLVPRTAHTHHNTANRHTDEQVKPVWLPDYHLWHRPRNGQRRV